MGITPMGKLDALTPPAIELARALVSPLVTAKAGKTVDGFELSCPV
jgi:hypothetical protein